MKKKIEIILSYLVIASALQFAVLFSIAINFQFEPHQMAAPGMVIAFVSACGLNIVKLSDATASRKIYFMSTFANALTLSYAIALSLQDPHIAKVITTAMMALILLLSLISCFDYREKKLKVAFTQGDN